VGSLDRRSHYFACLGWPKQFWFWVGCQPFNLCQQREICAVDLLERIADAVIVEMIGDVCAEFPCYGYRRVTPQLRRDGITVNRKKVVRIMKEQDLTVRPHRPPEMRI
jgi:HTH-like domain